MLYAGDPEVSQISGLIGRSQIYLVVQIGIVAVITLVLSKREEIPATSFSTIYPLLSLAFETQIKLCQVILSKMIQAVSSNPYAAQLQQLVS
jgi:hypothetical protein